jgi:ATP-dependent RNA helicase DDX27
VGRTARAGRSGVSVSLAGEDERKIVREVVKKARNPVKSRLVPNEILDKYRIRVAAIQADIDLIVKEEWEEKSMDFVENQANRVERMLQGDKSANSSRTWFQTKKEREAEKGKL